jgi:hypothetical protein
MVILVWHADDHHEGRSLPFRAAASLSFPTLPARKRAEEAPGSILLLIVDGSDERDVSVRPRMLRELPTRRFLDRNKSTLLPLFTEWLRAILLWPRLS